MVTISEDDAARRHDCLQIALAHLRYAEMTVAESEDLTESEKIVILGGGVTNDLTGIILRAEERRLMYRQLFDAEGE